MEMIMRNNPKPAVSDETQRQSTTLQSLDAGRAIQRVEPLTSSPDELRHAMSPPRAPSQGFTQTFGLDFRAAILTFLVDSMVFGGDAFSLGLLIPLGIVVGAILAFIVYRIQIKWYGDDHDSALIKALIVGLLTAIPAPLGPLFAIPGGVLGLVNTVRRR
jgi:hypothetical protein